MTHFIVNPQSRSGKGQEIWNEVEKQLINKKIPYELHMTKCPEDAIDLARAITANAEAEKRIVNVVGLGGDGTLCEVLNGIELSDYVRLGYLPTGSGNDFGRSMHYPSNVLTMVERITDEPEFFPIDFGVMKLGGDSSREHRFAVSCGIGFDASVCHGMLYTKWKKILNAVHLGKLSYIIVGLKELVCMKTVNGYLELDGERIELKKLAFVSFHVQPYEGGGFKFAPKADCQDGRLELCVMAGGSRLELVPVLLNALFGRSKDSAHVHHYSCRTAKIHLDKPCHVHTDGEVYDQQTDIVVADSGRKINLIKI